MKNQIQDTSIQNQTLQPFKTSFLFLCITSSWQVNAASSKALASRRDSSNHSPNEMVWFTVKIKQYSLSVPVW